MTKGKPLDLEPDLDTAHAVRNLRVCESCHHLGDKRTMLFGKEHQSCFAERNKADLLAAVLDLPRDESSKLMLGIIGPDVMRRLLVKRGRK